MNLKQSSKPKLKLGEKTIETILFFSALITILTTVGIVITLITESYSFFKQVSVFEFLTETEWTPLFGDSVKEKDFGILPLLSGTFLTTIIALLVALPIGLTIAIYLNEYAPNGFRKTVKPMLEILAAIPTVVYGYFALIVITPFLQTFFPEIKGFNALSPGIVMGIMIIPFISSLSEDALNSVPQSLREASYGMGSTQLQTAFKVLVPTASSGIIASIILALSRAIGETMIVTIAAGTLPSMTLDPTVPIQTITAYIVEVSSGDVPQGSIEYQTIFAAGFTLFLFTLILNNISFYINKKFSQGV
ncbi:MAG: phosphate ABC transporter permease subunit PstC [Flavobacteriales bacterium]